MYIKAMKIRLSNIDMDVERLADVGLFAEKEKAGAIQIKSALVIKIVI